MTFQIGYWKCCHCSHEHEVLMGDSNNSVSKCPKVGLEHWIHVPEDWIYPKPGKAI